MGGIKIFGQDLQDLQDCSGLTGLLRKKLTIDHRPSTIGEPNHKPMDEGARFSGRLPPRLPREAGCHSSCEWQPFYTAGEYAVWVAFGTCVVMKRGSFISRGLLAPGKRGGKDARDQPDGRRDAGKVAL
jgi:hypothetical protein